MYRFLAHYAVAGFLSGLKPKSKSSRVESRGRCTAPLVGTPERRLSPRDGSELLLHLVPLVFRVAIVGLVARRLAVVVGDTDGRGAFAAALHEDMSLFVQLALPHIIKGKAISNCCRLESDEERTLRASLREKLFSQWPHGNGLTARWMRW